MSSLLSTLKITGAAAILALGLAAAPAMAQSGEPSMNFSLGLDNGKSSMSFDVQGGGEAAQQGKGGFGNGYGHNGDGYGNDGGFNLCLSNRDIIRGLRDYGFRRVEITDSGRRRAEVIGRWGRWDYLMRVNKCTGEVNIVDRLRRGSHNTGFGLQFSYN